MDILGLKKLGINTPTGVFRNLPVARLTQAALERGEGSLSNKGALVVTTGKYTGRSPKDKFIVDTPGIHDAINWGSVNRPVSRERFNSIRDKVAAYMNGRDIYVFDGFAGADTKYRQKFRVINELASQNLFITDLLIRPTAEELEEFGEPDYTILCAPGYKCTPELDGTYSEAAIMIDYEAHMIVICGSAYAGEIKKAVFSTMNFIMTDMNVLPMHCSSNMDPETHETAVFFGLSGTGKTTLSADPNRLFIGDDEHGWSPDGIFNFEGGCYAKCIDLNPEHEPEIYNAIRFGSLVENVVMNGSTRELDFANRSLTENTRVGYPVSYIPNAVVPSVGGIPKVVVFLTADAFGVLPPISRLSPEAAMYHFVTGFTSKLAGTERGITEPVPTFSTLFGEPFMPRDPEIYAQMLGQKIQEYGTRVFLINTGWAGGSASDGASRIPLRYTRAMVTAALDGELDGAEYRHSSIFNIDVPLAITGVPSSLLSPRRYWQEQGRTEADYVAAANKLAKLFEDNFQAKYPDMDPAIAQAGPHPLA